LGNKIRFKVTISSQKYQQTYKVAISHVMHTLSFPHLAESAWSAPAVDAAVGAGFWGQIVLVTNQLPLGGTVDAPVG